MKRILIALTFLSFSLSINAQDYTVSIDEKLEKDTSYFISGLRFTQFSSPFNSLQILLEANNFVNLEDYSRSYEWYIKTFRDKSKWEGSSSFGFYQRLTSNNQALNQASMIGLISNFEAGYNLTKGKTLLIKPFIGIGLEYYKLSFVENFQASSLSSITDSDFKNYNATSLQLPWSVGLEIGTSFQLKNTIIDLLLRGGYKLHLETDLWRIDDTLPINDEINLSSPFVGFSIGFSFLEH